MQQPSRNGWSVALAALFLIIAALINADQAAAAGSTSVCDPSTQVACRNYPSICIELERVQDGVADCPDASDEDCQPWEFTCLCGQPRCITGSLVGNGVLDCVDGSDEGLIGGNCKSDEDLQNIDDLVRFRRASSDVRVEVNGGQTTTFFLKTEVSRPRPLGIITSTKGAFVNEGTTTEYTTQIVGTSVDGTYAKIQSTKSRVFSLVPTDLLDLPSDLLPIGLVSSSLVTRIRGETTTIETTEFVRTFIDQAYVQEILTSSEIFAPLRSIDDQAVDVQPSPVNQIVIPTVVIDSSLADEEEAGKIVFKTSHLTSLVGERVIQSSISGIVPAFDEDKPSDDENKKIITSFEEIPDNNLRGSRARSDVAEPVVQTKPVVALETFVAGQPARVAEPAVESVNDEFQETTTLAPEDAVVDVDFEPVEDTTFQLAEEPEAAVKIVAPVESDVKVETPVSEQLAPAVISAVESDDALLEEEPLLDVNTDVPESATGLPESVTELSPEDDIQDKQRAPRVETRPPVAVAATLQLRPTAVVEPIRPVGLISSFEGSLVNEGITTVYTSLIFGTVIDGEWANVVSTVTKILPPTVQVLTVEATPPVAVVATALPADSVPEPSDPELEGSLSQPIEASAPVTETPQGLLPVTRVTTFTFFTTFTETKGEEEITSVSTREVVSSEVQFVEETIMTDDIIEMMLGEPGNETNPSLTTIFKTYTYFSTIFDESTTKMITREEVESTVVTLTDAGQLATPVVQETTKLVEQETTATKLVDEIRPSVIESSLMEAAEGGDVTSKRKQLFSSLASGIVKTFFTTFTFFTTALVNGTTVVSSRIVVSTNAVTPTVQLTDIDEELWESLKAQDDSRKVTSSVQDSVSTVVAAETSPVLVAPSIDLVVPVVVISTPDVAEPVSQPPEILEPVTVETSEEPDTSTDIIPTPPAVVEPDVPVETPLEDTRSTEVVSELPAVVSESPVEEIVTIEPSTATEPSLPQTFYTTFTYLTTFFTEGTSNIVSREETVTNVMTETDLVVVEPTVPSVFPITYFTTFTYRTTSFSEGETFVSTREETVTNIVTPTVGAEASDSSAIEPSAATAVPIQITPTPTVDPALTTFYTTFTYFATSFEADTAIVTSSLETVTNIVSASETIIPSATLAVVPTVETDGNNTARNIGTNGVSQLILDLSDDKTSLPSLTGLLSTIRSTRINNGVTTVFTTDVLGTFINGQYARILESSSEVVNPGAKVAATVIVAASGVEGLEATDLFSGVVSPSAELEGSIVQPAGPSISEEQGNEGGSKVDAGRITTRLSAPPRNRTFVPTIRPFTQRPRPPLPTRPRRPPFTSASGNEETTSSASSIPPSAASTSSSSSRAAPFTSRFRLSGASSLVVATTTATESSSRSQFFRLRSSASSSINPTPVLASASASLPPRRFSSNSFSPSVAASRSSLGGLAARRPSILSSGVRASGAASTSTVGSSSVSSTSTTPRFSRPSTAAPIEDDTTDDNVETVTPASGRAVSSFRRPALVSRPSSAVVEPSSPVVPSRRQFPFSRSTARPAVTESTRAPSESLSSNSASSSDSTSRPRFVRPPKLTFTEKPRPAVKLPTRPAFRSEAVAASSVDEVTVEAPVTSNERSKRQIDFDYYFYDPLHYRRPSRSKTSRTRGRNTSASRVIESDYDYDLHLAQLNGQDYDGFDYDEQKVTRPRQTSSTSASTSALRDRLRANQQSRNQATTPATRSRTRTNSAALSSSGRQSAIGRNRKPAPEEVGQTTRNRATTGSANRSRPESAAAARQRARTSTTTERTSAGGRRFGNSRRNQNRNRVTNDFPEDDGFISAEPVLPSSAPPLTLPLTVTHRIPTDTTIPVVNNGKTEFRTVIAAKPSVEILEQYSTLRVGGTWRYIASEVTATPAPGTTLITQLVLKPSETTTVTFTPTTIRGRPTSFSHIVPSTAFEVETVVSTLTDPLASTNSLLQQLLLGGLQQANGVPVTSFNTHTSTFVTTLTELKTTKIPITLRGQEIFTTIIGSSTSVITATEFSTETIVIGPTESPQGNPLASLLPALLGNQLLQAQLLAPQLQPSQVLPILPTLAPQAAITIPENTASPVVAEEVVVSRFDEFEEVQFEPIEEEIQQPAITPAKPIPMTSVITLFLSGRRPGEFSSILSTITLDGVASDVTVVKRQIDPSDVLPMESSQLPLMVGTDKGIYELPEHYSAQDLDYYLMSAINEIDAEAIDDVGETSRLASIVKKAKRAAGRQVRQVTDEWLEEPLESIESQIDQVKVEPLPAGRGALRRKTVTVTRKVSEPVAERKIADEFVSNNRGRKVVVVTRRRPVSSTATAADQQEPPMSRRIDNEQDNDTEAKPFVVVRKRPVNKVETNGEAPELASSLVEPETESPLKNNLFGDVYAPRTYYTVYSYFYTLLNGPNSGQVSTREVSISEIVRGSDGRIPLGFQRTENGNGLYPLSSGKSVADLSTRVNNGVTTQVNLASMTLVKYGRGAVRASSIGVKPKEEAPVRQTTQQPRRINIVPSPRVEPSFDDFISDAEEVTVEPTQKLPAVTRSRGRASEQIRSTATRQPAIVEETTASRASGSNRGRGTVRFNPATVLGETLDIPLATISRPRVSAESRVPQRAPSPPSARGPARGSVRGSVSRDKTIDEPVPVRTPVRGRGRPQPVQLEQDLFVEEEPFVEEEFFDNEFVEDVPLEEDYLYDHHEDDLPLGPEEEYDYFTDAEEPAQVDVNVVETATPAVKTTAASVTPSASSTVVSSTKVMGVTPTRTTISRKLLNPLQSHLSSILANSRSGLRASSSVQRTNEPGSSIPFRSRAHSKSSVAPTFTTSTVVFKQFQTLSTLAVDGGRSGIPLTLITSSLTTLFDSELSLLTESPDVFKAVVQPTLQPISRPKPLNLKPTARLTLPIRASVAIGLLPSTGTVESTIEDTTDSGFETTELPSISELLLLGGNIVTVVETQFKTFTAVVTRKSGTEEEVTTRLEVLPELVTKTIVQIEPTSVVDVQASLDALENLVPTARAIPARDGREQFVGDEDIEELRGARLNVGAGSSNRNPNFATKIMSNGVEVIVASEKKPTLLAQNVVQKSQTVIEPSPPITLAGSTLVNQVTMAGQVDNVRLFSSIQSDPARFQTLTQMTTFTYLTTLFDGASKLVSSREEVITNFVTQEKGRKETVVKPTATVTTGLPGSSNYNTFTQMTTYTYFNTFVDLKRPVVLTSKETVSNVVTVPADQPEATERSFETATYLRTYIFSSKLDRDAIATSKEVVTQVVVTEAPRLKVQPTPVVTFSEVTKTYLNTFTLLSTQVEGTKSIVHRITTVRPEIVVETIRDFEPTPVLEGSQIMPTEDDFETDGPLVATKTYFTTKTHFTTLQQGTKTIVQSRKEVQSSVVTETIDGLAASLFANQASSTKAQAARPTYVQLGPNLYGKLRTLFATATYYITNSVGQVTSKSLVVPQITTETVPLESIPSEALIEPSLPVLSDIEATPVPSSSQILTADQLQALKQSFLAGQQSTVALQPSLVLSPEQLSSIKESFLASQPGVTPTSIGEIDTSTDPVFTGDATDPTGDGFQPPEISLSPPDGATVIMVTNTAGEVLIIPTEILDVQPTATTSTSSSGGISGGTLASILGGLGTLGLTALGQSLANNNPGGLNINLGPVFDAMTGVLSNGLIASRRNSTDRSDSGVPHLTSVNQPSNTFPPSPRTPTHEPLFIPIGGLAGVEQQPGQDAQGRRPPNFIPLRPNQPQRPPSVLRRPEPGIPLQPGVPGSPLLRPGTSSGQQFGVVQPGQVIGQPAPISFSAPPLQTGFTGMPNQPKSVLPATRAPGLQSAVPGVRPPPPPFVNGQNNIDRVQIDPSRPIQPAIRPTTGQFFAANGQQINVPPLPVGSGIPPPPPASPPPPPPGPVPQPPVDAIRPGAIVPGPDGKPVRIVGVPEGQQPPPGAEGQVFIRPVPVPVPVGPAVPPGVRNEQPPRREDAVAPPTAARPQQPFQTPAVQTIASIVGENKIVATNIISGGQTIVVQPNDPTPVFNAPSSVLWPSSVAIRPSAVEEVGAVQPSDLPEAGGVLEGVGSILQPGLAPSASSSLPPADASTSVTPSHEFAFGSESGEVDHTPTLNIFSDSPSTEIMPSVFQNAPSEAPTSAPTWPFVVPDVAKPQEPFGVTSVVMGPNGEDFTTVVSRVESDGRTAFTTIIQQSTTVTYVEPTTTVATTSSTSTTWAIEEEKNPEPVLTFPPDSPFVPPTNQPFRPQSSSSSSSTSTTRARPTTTTPAADIDPPVAKDVIMDNTGNKAVLGGFGGSFSVNQPSTIQDGCRGRCSKEKSEICIYSNGQHDCLCRPGYSRSDPSEVCSKTYTYQLKLVLESMNRTMLHFDNNLKDEISPQYRSLASNARAGLKQALMRTDLSESVQDSQVMGIHPTSESELQSDGILVDFFVHLRKQQDEDELKNKLMKSLEGNNYLLGDSDIIASRFTDSLSAQDFDECSHEGHHDCSEFADCINEKGTYRCQCRPGFVDSSDEDGRICLAERQDCEECNGHGRCVFEPTTNEMTCICNKWFAGSECQVNLKVVMIVVLAVGIFVILLITAIIVVCCLRSRRAKGSITGGPSFLRYRGPSVPASGTLDRAAMIRGDTSSEGSGNDNFAAGSSTLDGKTRAVVAGPALQSYRPYGEGLMIPRAKHQHGPSTSANPGSAERGEAAPNREHQLMDYLDGRGPKKVLPDREGKMQAPSEVLSAGGRTSVSSTSQFRDSLEHVESAGKDTEEKTDNSVLDMTVSEVRSFDETTIHPATRRPAQYYQSDDAESASMATRNAAGVRDSVSDAGQNPMVQQQLLSFPQPFTITRPKLYNPLSRE